MDKKNLLFFLILFISPSFLIAQKISLDVQASVNYPLIPSSTRSYYPEKWAPIANESGAIVINSSTKIKESYSENPGGKIGLNVSLDLKKNFFLRTGIGLNYISFKREFQYTDLGELDPGGFTTITITEPGIHSPDIGKTYLLYTDIPVSAGVNLLKKKLELSLGVTVSLLTFSKQYLIDRYVENNQTFEKIVEDNSCKGLSKVSFSAHVELAYRINSRFSVFTRYSRQLTPIYDKDYQYVGKAMYNLIEVGAGYRL